MSKLERDAANFRSSLAKVSTASWHSTQPNFSSTIATTSASNGHNASGSASGTGSPGSSVNAGGDDRKEKKKRPKTDVVYSQPADTGVGSNMATHLLYAVEWLKNDPGPRRISDIALLSNTPLMENRELYDKFITHEKIIWNSKSECASYKHDFEVRNKPMLLTEIERAAKKAKGLAVRQLKDSWKDAPAAIEELEKTGEVLVTRTGKDSQMKYVFYNEMLEREPTARRAGPNESGLCVDKEFCDLWHSLDVPNDVDLLKQLEQSGLQATMAEAQAAKTPAAKKRGKKNAPRTRQPKITNLHLKGTGIDLTKSYVPPGK